MTSSSSKPSTVKPLTEWERAAWAATNRAEEKERYQRFQSLTFTQKVQALEARGRELAQLRESIAQRQAISGPAKK